VPQCSRIRGKLVSQILAGLIVAGIVFGLAAASG
jgi:hypothetical protein